MACETGILFPLCTGPLAKSSFEKLHLLLQNKKPVHTILGERALGMESENPALGVALTLGELPAHFSEINNNS